MGEKNYCSQILSSLLDHMVPLWKPLMLSYWDADRQVNVNTFRVCHALLIFLFHLLKCIKCTYAYLLLTHDGMNKKC